MGSEMKELHIYGQTFQHTPAQIVGTREALEQLRALIDSALANQSAKGEFSVNDGEGYDCEVVCTENMAALDTPYSDEDAHYGNGEIEP